MAKIANPQQYRGYISIFLIILIVVIAYVCLLLVKIYTQQNLTTFGHIASTQAFYLAEGAMEIAVTDLNTRPNFCGHTVQMPSVAEIPNGLGIAQTKYVHVTKIAAREDDEREHGKPQHRQKKACQITAIGTVPTLSSTHSYVMMGTTAKRTLIAIYTQRNHAEDDDEDDEHSPRKKADKHRSKHFTFLSWQEIFL